LFNADPNIYYMPQFWMNWALKHVCSFFLDKVKDLSMNVPDYYRDLYNKKPDYYGRIKQKMDKLIEKPLQ